MYWPPILNRNTVPFVPLEGPASGQLPAGLQSSGLLHFPLPSAAQRGPFVDMRISPEKDATLNGMGSYYVFMQPTLKKYEDHLQKKRRRLKEYFKRRNSKPKLHVAC